MSPNQSSLHLGRADLAKLIDHAILRPELTDREVVEGCHLGLRYCVASVCARPCDVGLVQLVLEGSSVKVGTVIGFPHGNSTTATKVFEAECAIGDGASELDLVINIGRARSGQISYVEDEIQQVASVCHGLVLKVILENAYLTDTEKIEVCKAAERAGAQFVKTSTGFAASGSNLHDLRLMRQAVGASVQIKAAGGIRTLAGMREALDAGATRIGTTATASILDSFSGAEATVPEPGAY